MTNKSARVKKSIKHFNSGYNCSQSVLCSYADLFDLDHDNAMKLASGFGGGLGGMRRTCGALTGAIMLTGLLHGNYDPNDNKSKRAFYKIIQNLEAQFTAKFQTSNCKELLTNAKVHFESSPMERTPEYYSARPCSVFVSYACELFETLLTENKKEDAKK